MKLYRPIGSRQSAFTLPDGTVVSYLVHHTDGYRKGSKHFSYGFDPTKPFARLRAMANFKKYLLKNKATRYDPDGGRLDGRDFREC